MRIRSQIRICMDPFSVELLDPDLYLGAELYFYFKKRVKSIIKMLFSAFSPIFLLMNRSQAFYKLKLDIIIQKSNTTSLFRKMGRFQHLDLHKLFWTCTIRIRKRYRVQIRNPICPDCRKCCFLQSLSI